jgi:hemolysin activation/secretion protein
MRRKFYRLLWAATALLTSSGAMAQVGLNRADPSILERSLPNLQDRRGEVRAPILDVPATVPRTPTAGAPRIASSIVVQGSPEIARDTFSGAILPYIGKDLSSDDLQRLASGIADAARRAGFPFASVWIEPQAMADGILRVKLDAGALAAVPVIGAINPYADHILTQTLVTGRAVRRAELERAILLVGDIPGVTVKQSRYIRQDGFGILLVTIVEDRASLYAQVDNRGSKEIGPIRSTLLASLRGVLQPGDELGLISAQTPLQPSEFIFLRGRYTAPVDADGATLSISGSYGRAQPGASLKPLHVVGKSFDAALSYSRPLLRSRKQSLWGALELRGLRSDLTLLHSPLRNDRLVTLTASLNGNTRFGPGVLRGEVMLVDGLPVPGVTHQGDPRISRSDGDARFVTLGYDADWTARMSKRVSLVLASQAQVASRPLLATAEIGVGGPAFGRGYDSAERTGDDGILGSGELRFDLGRVVPHVVDRLQLYGSVDGGYVGNLRGGSGGGALLSTAAGVRLGRGRLDGMFEIAMPLNRDRFDTSDRRPRISFRISRVF